MARAVTYNNAKPSTLPWHGVWGCLIFFPILWTILTSFKTEAQAISDPPVFLFFDWTLENYSVVQERSELRPVPVELDHHRRGLHHPGYHHRGARRLVDGLCALEADQRHPVVDAVHQDAASSWRSLPDLPAVHQTGLAGYQDWSGDRADADQPADHRLDALHLLQGNPRARSSKRPGWMVPPCAKRCSIF